MSGSICRTSSLVIFPAWGVENIKIRQTAKALTGSQAPAWELISCKLLLERSSGSRSFKDLIPKLELGNEQIQVRQFHRKIIMTNTRFESSVLIVSSSESKEIAEYLQLALDEYLDSTIWDQGVFILSTTSLLALLEATRKFDFAIMIYAADDALKKRNIEKAAPRDNVIFESGLFMGALGLDRTYLVYCVDDNLHIPSDLSGLTFAPFRRRHDGNLQAALTPVSVKIREAIRKLGTRKKQTASSDIGIDVSTPAEALVALTAFSISIDYFI